MAEYAIRLIGLLYKVERWAEDKNYSSDQRQKLRQRWSVKIINWLHELGKKYYSEYPPSTPISEAIGYMLKNMSRLLVYTENGDFQIDNNPIENKIRPSVLGRRSFLFVGSESGGQWAAMFYTFFANCKLSDISPQTWLEETLRKINSTAEEELEILLPIKNS
ncbi:IS66 family transposase [Persicobacter diffluens]|uniref:Transposase IS66 central domain-containing protein n=1 Tax=Persicobacter diffluens TaxID=981 RepID=A0AAN5AQ14_9BACT|nr:hypothetical protein PEDI_53930 [Persicobacter diffluens]